MEIFDEKKQKNKINLLKLLSIVLLGVILFVTNPNEKQFKEFIKEELIKEANKEEGFTGAVMEIFASPTAWLIGLSTERNDFLLFSYYTLSGSRTDIECIGIFNHFFRVK